jgi:hypothetical protein
MNTKNSPFWALVLALTIVAQNIRAQEVFIPDAGLSAAIRDALQKPNGPLTGQDLLSLKSLDACCRSISSTEGLEAALNLVDLDLDNNNLSSFAFSTNFINLRSVNLAGNQITNVSFVDGLTNLGTLVLEGNQISTITLPEGLTGLLTLELGENQFAGLALPKDMGNLMVLDLGFGSLSNLTIPAGLTNLNVLALSHNQLTSLTLPPDATNLSILQLAGNPFSSLILTEESADSLLASTVASLRRDGISVSTYENFIRLGALRQSAGNFQFTLEGPPGVYTIQSSVDLLAWNDLGFITNGTGTVDFSDSNTALFQRKFYRAILNP